MTKSNPFNVFMRETAESEHCSGIVEMTIGDIKTGQLVISINRKHPEYLWGARVGLYTPRFHGQGLAALRTLLEQAGIL